MTPEPAPDLIYEVAASPDFARDGRCWIARTSGLFASADRGDTWKLVYRALGAAAGLPTLAVSLSPSFTADHMVIAGVAGGVLRSVDAGRSWEPIALPSPPPVVSCLAFSPDFEQDGFLFAGTLQDGVFRSPDRGHSWHSWNFGMLDMRCLALVVSPAFSADETLFAATETALYRSTNGGRAWREMALPSEACPVASLALSSMFLEDGVILAGTEEGCLQRSRDRGRTWVRLGGNSLDGAINAVLVSPDYPRQGAILVLCDDRLLLSRDDGETWMELPGEGVSAVVAPAGLGAGALVLAGKMDGSLALLPLP